MDATRSAPLFLLDEQHPDWSVVMWSLCTQTAVSHPPPRLTHVTQLVKAVFHLPLHSDTALSLLLKALCLIRLIRLVSTIHTEQSSGVLCVLWRREINRTDVNEGSLTSSHTFSQCSGHAWRQNPKQDAVVVPSHIVPQPLFLLSVSRSFFICPH